MRVRVFRSVEHGKWTVQGVDLLPQRSDQYGTATYILLSPCEQFIDQPERDKWEADGRSYFSTHAWIVGEVVKQEGINNNQLRCTGSLPADLGERVPFIYNRDECKFEPPIDASVVAVEFDGRNTFAYLRRED